MRIVYTVLNGRVAGGQMICLKIMQAARAVGHEVCLVTPTPGELTDLLEAQGVLCSILPMTRSFNIHQAYQFALFLKRWKADLVHCHDAVVGTILAGIGAKIARVPLITHVHIENKFSDKCWISATQLLLYNWTSRWTRQIVTISEDTRKSLAKQGLKEQSILVIPNGVEIHQPEKTDLATAARAELGLSPDVPVVGTVARLCPVKGQRELLQAARLVRDHIPATQFVIIGEDLEFGGAYRKELESYALELGLSDSVLFTGYKANAATLMNAFSIFVLPSWIEGMPVTILESMAAGKAVVATPVGGVPEVVVDGETGLLVPPRDAEALANAITNILSNPNIVHRMGEAGRERVYRHFSVQMMVDQAIALYDRAAQR